MPCAHLTPNHVRPCSEDCLFLNVWTPAGHAQAVREGRASLLPVVLWIHGGAFFMGSGANPSTSPPPDVFVRAANVIYVTFNYRLGVLGWLVSSALPDNGGLQGIQDQLLSMAWVRDHIRAFGGDPSQVTLQGESAGAISICVHLALPAAKGLFKKAILQSGICAFPFEDIATAYAGKERLSKAVGCHRTVTAEDGTGGTDMRPARAPPVSTITRSQPDAPDSASMSSSGTPVEGGKAILHDSIIQLPVEQDDGEAHTSGAAGMKVEKEAHELSEARQRSIQSHAGTASDTPSFTSWQAASLWVRARMLWPWSMEQDREEGPAGRNNAHATEGRTQTASSGKVSPSTNEPTPSTSHSTGGMLRRLVSSLSHSIRGLQHGAAASVPASSSPEGAPVHNLHEFLKPATANPYSTVHYVGSESDSIVSLGRPRTWSAWRASVSALSRFTENHAAPRQSMPAKRVGRQGDQSGRVAYKPPVWSKKQLIRDSDELECMRTLSAETMVAAMTARRGIFFYEGETWGPVVDGILLPDHPLRMIKTGMADVSNVDILYGHNKDEASLFVLFAWPFLVSRQLIWDFIHATLGPEHAQGVWDTYIEGETHPHVRAAMPAITTLPTPITAGGHPSVSPSPQSESTEGRPGGKAEDTLRVKAVRMLNDYWKCASFSVAEQLSQHGARVRVYQFIHTPSYLSNWFQWLGAFHGAELDFALAAFTQHEPQPAEARLAAHMARLWGEFVTGKRLRVQEVPGASRTNSTGTEGSTNETTVYTYTFVADQSNLASHPPLAVHPGPYPGTSHSQYLANALLGKGKEPLLVSEAHVDPAMIHVNDVEWPLYAPPGRSALSTEPVDTPVQGLAVGHDRGVCLQLQAEPSFTLSPRGTCRPAECALWDATLSHGFIMRMPPQMKEPLVSQLTNVWVPKALTWLSKHLPHLNVLGVMLVMFVLLLAAWPAGREVSRRWQNNMRAVLHSDKAAMAPSTTPYRWGLPAHSSYGFRPAASGNKGLPGAPPSRVSSFLHHVNEDVKHVLPRHHSHTHREHMPGSVGVYGPTVEMAEFMEHCDDSECGDSEDDAQEGTAPNQRTPRGVGRLRGRSLRSKVAAKLRQRIPHPLQQDHDLAQVEAAALSYAQVGGHAVWLALSCIGQLCWGFSAGLYAVLTEQCRRPRHRGRLLNMQTG